MATLTGENLLNSIIETTGVEINVLIFNTLSVKLQQMIDHGTYSKLAAATAMSGFSTAINAAGEITALSDAIETNTDLIKYADEDDVGTIKFPLYGDNDDYAADGTTSGYLFIGDTVSGTLETNDDEDWFQIDLSGGTEYEFTLSGYEGSEAPWIKIYDSGSDTTADKSSLEGNLNFIPSSDGTYYVGIEDGFSTDLSPLDYILHVTAKETIYVGSIHDTYPYSAVVYIEARFPSGEMYTGSGVVVGRNDVLTASHLIYSVEEGGLAEDITVYPGRNGSDMPFGSYDWDFVNYFEVDLDGDGYLYKSDSEKDLAVIGFDQPIGDETGWFGLDGNGTSGNYNLTGYPGIYADETGVRMTNDYGFASKDENSIFNYSSMEINPGNSGGPLWYLSDLQDPFVVGIASTKDWAAGLELHYDTVMDWIESNNYLLGDSLSMETLSEAAGLCLARDYTELEIMGLPTELDNLS
jgi:V8-like Glu-specific endopeptidase